MCIRSFIRVRSTTAFRRDLQGACADPGARLRSRQPSATEPFSGPPTSAATGTRSSDRFPPGSTSSPPGCPIGARTSAAGSICPEKHTPERDAAARPSMRGPISGTTMTIRSCTCDGSSHGAFQPNFRSHGSRLQNEVWSYGKQAEPILAKYLRLRYQLMAYIYSIAHKTHLDGAPFMRACSWISASIQKVADIRDEYMFGPALLIGAPVTEQGKNHARRISPRRERIGTTSGRSSAFAVVRRSRSRRPSTSFRSSCARARSSPLGAPVESTNEPQPIATVRVYVGK